MKTPFLLLAVLALAGPGAAWAQEKDAPAKPEKVRKMLVANEKMGDASAVDKTDAAAGLRDSPAGVVAAFFGSLEKGEVDQAYSALTKGSKIAEKPDELKQLKTKTREAVDIFGSVLGYDAVDKKMVGTRLVRCTYVSLGKVFPLRWRFYFYKSEDAWRLIDMRVDDKLPGIFDEPEDVKPAEPAP